MCGINGTTRKDRNLVKRMNDALSHRGPDGTAVVESEYATLGHDRLAILDLRAAADQPMTSSSGRFTIVYNGELYNFRDLKRELEEQYQFKTTGDTEVLLAAYEKWGEGMLKKLNGIFAFAILDNKDGSLLLVRDHIGVKPLYYGVKDGELTFSSELRGMVAAGYKTLDTEMAGMFISMQYIPSSRTLLKGVSKLQPGELLCFKEGKIEREFYDIGMLRTQSDASGSLYEIVDQAVERQMVSDREVGVFLSGGLDSSVVLHHAQKHQPGIRTFSLGFELTNGSALEQERFNYDVEAAEKTAAYYGVNHTSITLTHQDVAGNLIDIFGSLDEPVANPTALTKYMLSKYVREAGVVVALGGDGGDEIFKGYPRYRAALAAEYFQRLPRSVQKMILAVVPKYARLQDLLGPDFHAKMLHNTQVPLDSVLKSGAPEELIRRVCREKYELLPEEMKGAQAFMTADSLMWLPDESLHTTDRATMAHGLEYRVPLLDLEIVAYANSLPLRQHISLRTGKKFLQHTYKSHLPPHLFGPKKRGWMSPASKWLRNDSVKELVTEVMSDTYYDGLTLMVDWEAARALLEDHVAGRTYAINPVWNLVQLQVWSKSLRLTIDYEYEI